MAIYMQPKSLTYLSETPGIVFGQCDEPFNMMRSEQGEENIISVISQIATKEEVSPFQDFFSSLLLQSLLMIL